MNYETPKIDISDLEPVELTLDEQRNVAGGVGGKGLSAGKLMDSVATPTDSVALSYGKIEWEYTQQK